MGEYLVCVDGTEHSRSALLFACKKAQKRGVALSLLHVVPLLDLQNLFGVIDTARKEQQAEAEKLMQSLSTLATELMGTPPTLIICEGNLGDEILRTAMEKPQIHMVVLGASPESSGKGKLVKWLAAKLGDRLLVPLMLVPGNLTDQQIDELA